MSRSLILTAGTALAVLVAAACDAGVRPVTSSVPIEGTVTARPTEPAPSAGPIATTDAPGLPSVPPARHLGWTTPDPVPDLRPKRGFEHTFLASDRGAVILVRYLEGSAQTMVASTEDGLSWRLDTVPSGVLAFGQSIDGGTDYLQVVPRIDGSEGLDLVSSPDGRAWTLRGSLPTVLGSFFEGAVNGESILVCGGGPDGDTMCVASPDGGSAWGAADQLAGIGIRAIRDIAPLGPGFLMLVEGDARDQGIVLTSPDGLAWTRQADVAYGSGSLTSFGSDVLLATSLTDQAETRISRTPDGTTWEGLEGPATKTRVMLLPIGDALLAIGTANEPEGSDFVTDLATSTDGRTWVAAPLPPGMADWRGTTFLPVRDGVVALDGNTDAMLVGRLTAD